MSQTLKSKRLTQKNNSLSQQTLEQTFGDINVDIDDQVNNLVRYIINRAGSNSIIKSTEIKKNVLNKVGSKFQEVVEKAKETLKNVYGYNLLVSDQTSNSSREYVISNALPYIKDPTIVESDGELPADVHKVLLLLILSHIFMSNEVVSEVSLYAFLQSLGIDVEKKHDLFGNVRDYIHHNLKNKRYLKIDMDQITKKALISWGPRAEKEISKHDILKFVCKIYNDRLPNSWVSQFKIAEAQKYENYKE